MRYGLAKQGVFMTVQGEGSLAGVPMAFVRLAGCPVGCPDCDTDYGLATRAEAADVARMAVAVASPGCEWVWVTGGEPTVYDLPPLYAALRKAGFRIALATAGITALGPTGYAAGGPDFVSVSPHRLDNTWVQRAGDQVNVVPGLNGLALEQVDAMPADTFKHFNYRYVTPVWYGATGTTGNAAECAAWVMRRPGWRLGNQNHKNWGVA